MSHKLLSEIKKLREKLYHKQKDLLEMNDFYKIEMNDNITLKKYINEIKFIEIELSNKINLYKKRQKLFKEFQKNLDIH